MAYNAIISSSNHIYLDSATMSVPLPVIHQLGSELKVTTFGGDVTDHGDGSYTINGTGLTYFFFILDGVPGFTIGNRYTLEYTISNISLTSSAIDMYNSLAYETLISPSTNGVYSQEFTYFNDELTRYMLLRSQAGDVYTISDISIKEITNANSYAYRYDVATKSVLGLDISTLAPSRFHSLTSSFSQWFTTDIELTSDDKAYIETHPWCIADLVAGTRTHPALSFTGANIVNYVPVNEGLAGAEKLYDATDGTGATYYSINGYLSTCRTNYLNTTYGLPNIMTVQDASGRITGMAAAGTTQWVNDDRSLATGWTITAPFTITEIIDGSTYSWLSDGSYYIDAVLAGTYTVPTGEWIMQNNLAFDGVTTVTARGNTSLVQEVIIP